MPALPFVDGGDHARLLREHRAGDHARACRYEAGRRAPCAGEVVAARYKDGVVLFICEGHVEHSWRYLTAATIEPYRGDPCCAACREQYGGPLMPWARGVR
jgi:hypothetical protein